MTKLQSLKLEDKYLKKIGNLQLRYQIELTSLKMKSFKDFEKTMNARFKVLDEIKAVRKAKWKITS